MRPRRSTPEVRLDPREVVVDGRRVRLVSAGEGLPLVLVHGLAGSSAWWRPTLGALAARRRVHLVDLPGFGDMHGSARYLRSRDAARWLGELMDAAAIAHADVAGHSLGGMVAVRLAARRPALVRRLALVAPAGMPAGRSALGYVMPLARSALAFSPSFALLLARDALRAGPLAVADAARGILSADVREDLAAVQAPVLLIWGERDLIVPPTMARAFRDALPEARLELIAGAGHVPMHERPDPFARALLSFLDDQPSDASSSTSAASTSGDE